MSIEVTVPVTGKMRCVLPYDKGNRALLSVASGTAAGVLKFDKAEKVWLVPRSKLDQVVRFLALRFGRVDVYQQYTLTMRCDTRCTAAKGTECVCSCLGENHAGGRLMTTQLTRVGESTKIDLGQEVHEVHRVAFSRDFGRQEERRC